MENLWKKEVATDEYVDLFASVKHPAFDAHIDSLKRQQSRKNNQQSNEWRLKGNAFYQQENWVEALKCYNESLCFAEIGSECAALAYSNRSACNFNMQLYKEVLIDIELAKSANLPDRLMPQLQRRIKESMKLMATFQRKAEFEPKLSYEADRNFPCMSNVVEIKYNKEFGRHLRAKCDIPAGQTLLVENDMPGIRDDILSCHYCLQISTNLIPCPNCPHVKFCSVDCLNREEFHKLECGSFLPQIHFEMRHQIKALLLAINSFADVDSLMQFVERVLLEPPETLPKSLNDPTSKYHFFLKLSTSAPFPRALTEAYKIFEIAINLPKVSKLFDSSAKKRFLQHLALHSVLIYNTNSFGSDQSKFVANVSSLLNHSCCPNIITYIFSSNIISVSARPIKKDEQLFFNYVGFDEMSSNVHERKAKLKTSWGFDCKCEKCQSTGAPVNHELITSDPCYKYLVQNKSNKNEADSVQAKCIEFLNKFSGSTWSTEIEFVFNVFEHFLNDKTM